MANKVKIRQGKPTDAFHLLLMMREYIKTDAPHFPEPDDADCLDWLLSIINSGGCWVAIAEGKIIGSIGCYVRGFPWNKKLIHVYNEWFYVRPQFRKGGRVASDLLRLAKDKAAEGGFSFIFEVTSGKDIRVDRFISMQGFSYLGGIFASWPEEENGITIRGRNEVNDNQ